ncbi:MAG: phosphate ABC transporter ATP-binding protein [Candidatus Moduliflexus flocculans]|nr:phosphate ABC transporter ATP-binding protein [Candidatus Moduliflexus flocculans]
MAIIEVRDLDFYYGKFQALKGIGLDIEKNRITALIGPSGCGKTTFLRPLNRMTDLIDDVRVTGRVLIDGRGHLRPRHRPPRPAQEGGHGLPAPQPLPPERVRQRRSTACACTASATRRPSTRSSTRSLEAVHLWDELKDRLDENALRLSGEQQQRLCIARLVAVEPEILLMDEPCSALDLAATANIEDLMAELKKRYTILIVTHNMQQAARVSDVTGYFLLGELIEIGETRQIFTNAPRLPDRGLHHRSLRVGFGV